jgi:DNA modification methylase
MIQDLVVEYRDPAQLKRRANNPRTHSRRQIRQIAKSIKEFGFLSPILVDRQMQIVAGHGRADAAQLAGVERVPTLRVDHLSPAQIRAYVIADNKLAENAAWDRELLLLEIKDLEDVNFEITLLGFDDVELDVLLGGPGGDAEQLDQVSPPERDVAATSRRGDLWLVGPHRLLCGDATSARDFDTLMDGALAQCVFTDPPYNVRINGHASGLGKFKHEEFLMAAGEMTAAQFSNFLELSFRNLTNHTTDGSIHFVCMDWRHMGEILAAGARCYSELKNLCVWVKPNGGMGSLYRSRHELVFVFKNGSCAHLNKVALGKNGRNRTNVWEYSGASSFGADRDANLTAHPTVKPVAMVADAILDCSNRGDLILEPFAGSGTTLVAAHRMGRRVCAMELDPYYVDAILRRLQAAFGLGATLAASGQPFAEVSAIRTLPEAAE